MSLESNQFKGPFVLFGNGEIPSHKIPIQILKNAGTILCADGGADKLIKIGFKPNLILGDLDSFSNDNFDCDVIELKDQSKIDLQKCLDWCYINDITKLSLLGFSGKEDDHWMAALWTLITYHNKLTLSIYSNFSKIKCVKGHAKFDTYLGQTISIIPSTEKIEITSSGLKYSLNNLILNPPSFGTRNETLGDSFSIQSSGAIWVFLNY